MWRFLTKFWLFWGSNGDIFCLFLTYFCYINILGLFLTFRLFFQQFLAIFDNLHLVTLKLKAELPDCITKNSQKVPKKRQNQNFGRNVA